MLFVNSFHTIQVAAEEDFNSNENEENNDLIDVDSSNEVKEDESTINKETSTPKINDTEVDDNQETEDVLPANINSHENEIDDEPGIITYNTTKTENIVFKR